jgi:UDP-N-acetylmuramate dehydrogenase
MQFLKNISLKEYLTMQVDVQARKAVKVLSEADIEQLWKVYRHELQQALVIGGGSNLVITASPDQLVLLMEIQGIEVVHKEKKVLLQVAAGVTWQHFVEYCLNNNYGGVENLISIPGKVGAAPMQNIGAYGVEVKDTIQRVKVFDLTTGGFDWITNEDCHFGYRESIFKNVAKDKYIIVAVEFLLTTSNHTIKVSYGDVQKMLFERNIHEPRIQDVAAVIAAIRASKLPDPKELPNCGSFFKNPIVGVEVFTKLHARYPEMPHYSVDTEWVKIPAGWLIEKAGWKGLRKGKVGVHEKQALVIVNYDGADGNEILNFSKEIMTDIEQKFGITLEREVNFI